MSLSVMVYGAWIASRWALIALSSLSDLLKTSLIREGGSMIDVPEAMLGIAKRIFDLEYYCKESY